MWEESFRGMRYVFRRLSMQFLGILFHCIELFHYFVTQDNEFKKKIINGVQMESISKDEKVLRCLEQIKHIMKNPEHCLLGHKAEYKWYSDNNNRALKFKDYRISKFSMLGIIDHVCFPNSNDQYNSDFEDIKKSVYCCFDNELTDAQRRKHGGLNGYYILELNTHEKLMSFIETVIKKQIVKTKG